MSIVLIIVAVLVGIPLAIILLSAFVLAFRFIRAIFKELFGGK